MGELALSISGSVMHNSASRLAPRIVGAYTIELHVSFTRSERLSREMLPFFRWRIPLLPTHRPRDQPQENTVTDSHQCLSLFFAHQLLSSGCMVQEPSKVVTNHGHRVWRKAWHCICNDLRWLTTAPCHTSYKKTAAMGVNHSLLKLQQTQPTKDNAP